MGGRVRVGLVAVTVVATSISCRPAPGPVVGGPTHGASARPVLPSPPTLGWVVVDPLTLLREGPSASGVAMREHPRLADATEARESDLEHRLFRAVEAKDDLVGFEPVQRAPRGYSCTAVPEALSSLQITLWARRSELALVTTRKVRLPFDDGTAVTLAAGVVLRPDDQGHEVRVDGSPFHLVLPKDAVGHEFVPGPPNPQEDPVGLLKGPFVLGGVELGKDVLSSWSRRVFGKRSIPAGIVATLRTDCVQYEVLVPATAIANAGLGRGGSGGKGGPHGRRARVGAEVWWTSGAKAGTVVDQPVTLGGVAATSGGRLCFHHSLGGAEEELDGVRNYLQLCFDPKDLSP